MSDGPHRSLPAGRSWKKVAELTDNLNYDIQQVSEYVFSAIAEDFHKEVPNNALILVKSVFSEAEADLFPEQRMHDISNARRLVDGCALGCLFLECATQACAEGMVGQQGLLAATRWAIQTQMNRRARQAEELHLREVRFAKVKPLIFRQRYNDAIAGVAVDNLAKQVLGITPTRSKARIKCTKLDDGVPL